MGNKGLLSSDVRDGKSIPHAIRRQIVEFSRHRLEAEAVPEAVSALLRIIKDDAAPAPARVKACQIVLDRAGIVAVKAPESTEDKPLAEMSYRELRQAAERLRGVVDNSPMVDVTPGKAAE